MVAERFPTDARVRAVLGPTNTGKTHLAIERMLAHSSGLIGFPLRLLARENYDRMCRLRGAAAVALVTGEEKIVPPTARWFSCTAEAMPLDRPVEFLAVDEIQLCADPDRGHVFTARLLHARGLSETMFLGAETIRPLLQRLVPQAEIETRPRLSQLRCAGHAKLARLPTRSAVVAFSADEVYAIAEMIRRRRGGCAVVMGRLSPRTRNAQVQLYQQGEVDFLVATDAIGMGLNLDVDHVAFAGLRKFDGHRLRTLTPAEIAQIAGRAGRGMRDGSFGTTADCPPIDEATVQGVEQHQFDRLSQLFWRNNALDFSDTEALLASLGAAPPSPDLARGAESSDVQTLLALSRDPAIVALATGRSGVRALWEACQIPDFRKLSDDTHARLCGRVFTHLLRDGALPADWIGGQIGALDRTQGDMDTLMARLAGIRVWSYIAAHNDWVRDAPALQDQARAVEDRLSDALHERLTARFVDRRAATLMRRLDGEEPLLSAVTAGGDVVVEGHAVGRVGGFDFLPDPHAAGEERRMVTRAARRALRDEMPRRVALMEAAADTAFSLGDDGAVCWNGVAVARLRSGPTLLQPRAEAIGSEFLDGPQRERVRVRAQRFTDAVIADTMAPLFRVGADTDADASLRGPLHQLTQGGGVVPGATEAAIAPALRLRLKGLGLRAGRFGLFMPALTKPTPAVLRARLWAIHHNVALPSLPAAGAVSIPHDAAADWPAGFAASLGWVAAGPVLLRIDVAERVAGELAALVRHGACALPAELGSRLSVRPALVPDVLRGLGLRVSPPASLADGQFGPPAPALVVPPRRIRPSPAPLPARRTESPFAALAALRP